MSDLFKKINTLVRAQIDGFIEDDLRLPRRKSRSDVPFDPTGKDAARAIAAMRQQIEKALSYEDDLLEQIDALHQEASDLDRQADDLLQVGDEANARRNLAQLKHTERQITMLDADLVRHRQQTAELMDRVNVMESLVGAAQATAQQSPPAQQITTPTGTQEVNVPVTIVVDTDQPQEPDDSVAKPPPTQNEQTHTTPLADDDLAARRARLTQRPPKQQEE
ncbi:PspA/IM30 family protein [Chloroflexota bacterium]